MSQATLRGPMNGVDVPTLFATIDAVDGNRELAKFQFRATNKWETGTYSRTVTTEVNDQTTSVTRGASVSEGSAAISNTRTVNGKTVAAEKSAELDKEADTLSTSTTVTGPDGKQYNKETVRAMVTGAE